MNPLTVEFITETRLAAYYRVSAGKGGGDPVSVRIGQAHGIAVCLTCLVTTCSHARAADDYDREHGRPAVPAEAAA